MVKNHWRLGVVVLIYLVLATTHSLIVPLTAGNDEWAHFLYIRFIAENERLPATVVERDEAGYKSDAPPLYHLFVSGVTSGVEPARLLRTLNSPRRELADNISDPYALLHTGVELPPYRGEVLIWYLGRGISIFWGVTLILVTYVTSLTIFPRCYGRSLLASALLAFMPAVIFHSSVLSYESLSAVLTAFVLWVNIKIIQQPRRRLWWPILGILVGLSITIKYSAVLLPLEIIFVAWLALWVEKDTIKSTTGKTTSNESLLRRFFIGPVLGAGIFILLAAGWWFGFVIWNFNKIDTAGPVVGILEPLLIGDASDTTSVSVGTFLFGQDVVAASTRPLLERYYGEFFQLLLNSFWAAPVNGEFFLSPWLSGALGLTALFGLAGLGRVWQKNQGLARAWLVLLLFHTLLIFPLLVTRALLSFDPREEAQGRHILLPAASAIAILLVWGWSQWRYRISRIVIVTLLLWSVLGQVGWAALTYPAPIPVWTSSVAPQNSRDQQSFDHIFVDTIQLTGATWRQAPGKGALEIIFTWRALAENHEDYLLELQLTDQTGRLVGYTIGHPVQGRYPTRAWEPDDVIHDAHWLPLAHPLAGKYQLQLRLLDRHAQPLPDEAAVLLGEIVLTQPVYWRDPCLVWFQGQPAQSGLLDRPFRLRESFIVVNAKQPVLRPLAGTTGGTSAQTPRVSFGKFHVFVVEPDWLEAYQLFDDSKMCRELAFDLPPRHFSPPAIANPLAANFNNQVKLLGYELPARRVETGGRLPLTLYWQALDYMGEDYHIFDNLLDHAQNRWGGYDRRARDGYSTLLWAPGEVITDTFGVPVEPAAPNGIYTIDIGLYRQTNNGPVSLPLIVDGQAIAQTGVRVGPIKVGGPPPDVVIAQAAPQVEVKQLLGDQIILLGYDLVWQADSLALTLYWQANALLSVDYTTFAHLRDESNQNIVQKDNPPAQGQYPTSLWDPGEVIVDKIILPLDNVPPGTYTPVIGLYDPLSGERLLVPDNPANEIPLETVKLP